MRAKDIHKKRFAGQYPFGTDGALLITSGNTVGIAAGVAKDYSSIQIDAGGTLAISGSSGLWQFIGCAGTCVLNGLIKYQNVTLGTTTVKNATAPDGEAVSYTITQRNGGNGGGNIGGGVSGGGTVAGLGGGGSGVSNGGAAISTSPEGGSGSFGSDLGGDVGGGLGYNAPGNEGSPPQAGGNADSSSCPGCGFVDAIGCGGGGANRGLHGGGIWLKIKGDCSGTGEIRVSGLSGSNGAKGGDATAIICSCAGGNAYGGGGGGPGAGGTAGSILVRYHGAAPSWTLSKAAGTAGTAGAGGSANASPGTAFSGSSGSAGQNGLAGSSNVASY